MNEAPMTGVSIRVNGRWVDEFGPWGNPVVTWRNPLGSWELSWDMTQSATALSAHLAASGRVPVEACIGANPVWAGHLPVMDPDADSDEVTFTALGACREAEGAVCLTAAGATTSRPRTAAAQAKARGVISWRQVDALTNTPFKDPNSDPASGTDETDALNYLGALLDAWCEEYGQTWGVDGWRDVWVSAPPTSPKYLVSPTTPAMGVTSESSVNSLLGRYIATATGKLATARVGTGGPEMPLDLTKLGKLSAAQATRRLNTLLRKLGDQASGWKSGVTVSRPQVTTIYGGSVHLGIVGADVGRGGVMVRLMGQKDPRRPEIWNADVSVGEAVWNVEDDTLTLNPVDSESDGLDAVLSDAGVSVVS